MPEWSLMHFMWWSFKTVFTLCYNLALIHSEKNAVIVSKVFFKIKKKLKKTESISAEPLLWPDWIKHFEFLKPFEWVITTVYAQCLGFMQNRGICMGEKGLMLRTEWKLSNEREIFFFLPQQQKKRNKIFFYGAAYIRDNSVIITHRVGFSAFPVPATSSRQKANQSAVIGQQERDERLNRLVCFGNCFPLKKKINYTTPKHGGRRRRRHFYVAGFRIVQHFCRMPM